MIFEIDNALAVHLLNCALNNEQIPTNVNSHLVLAIQSLLVKDWHVMIQHGYREQNRCADFLHNLTFIFSLRFYYLL